MPPRSIKTIGRIAAFAAVAAAIVATDIHYRHDAGRLHDHGGAQALSQKDPLETELIRCRDIGMAAERDATCEAAWAENRRRFFAPLSDQSPAGKAVAAKPDPEGK